MKILLDNDTQDMILSLERIDVDYRRVSEKTSKEIVDFIKALIPNLGARALSVLVRDIETEREFYNRCEREHKTIDNWKEIEDLAIKQLSDKFEITTIAQGLYTNFINTQTIKPVKQVEIDIPNFSRFLKGAFIYALGRSSYMAGTTMDYINKYKKELNESDRVFILNEIEKYVEKYDNEDKDAPFHGFDSYIIEGWRKLASEL